MYLTVSHLCAVLSHSVVSDSLRLHGLQPTRHLCPWRFSRQEYWMGYHALLPPVDLPKAGTKPRSSTLQVDSLPSELPGKPKNTEVGSLSLLQGASQPRNPTKVSCIVILYQLSYQGSLISLICRISNMTEGNLSMKQKQNHRLEAQTGGCHVGDGQVDQEFGISRCKLLYIGWVNNKVLLYSTENCVHYLMINHNIKEYIKRMCIYTYMCIYVCLYAKTDSLCYTLEINTTL